MSGTQIAHDEGTAYDMPPGEYKSELVKVGRGTPMGELLRRYWHPVGLSTHATDTPREVRVLGEDLVLFRDGQGRAGLVQARCCHRGTTLYFGKVEDRGIRCCYHGWLFDVHGHCLEQPCEPNMGRDTAPVRQPWYPVQEQYGLIFAFMGPPAKKPVLPRYDCLEVLDDGEFIDADDTSIGSGGPAIAECNWLQHYENVLDAFHVPILHGTFSGTQFTEVMNKMPSVDWTYSPLGVKTTSRRNTDDGKVMLRVSEVALPTIRVVPNPFVGKYGRVESLGWTLPVDDTHYRIYTAGRVTEKGVFLPKGFGAAMGRRWQDMSPEERRARPGDFEAQVGQGPITLHSDENLRTSDRGIALLRRLLLRQVEDVANGIDPIGVSFDPAEAPIVFEASNRIVEA